MRRHEYIRHDEKAASRLAPKRDDGGFDLCVAVNRRDMLTVSLSAHDPPLP
jgi:hypothetical protein